MAARRQHNDTACLRPRRRSWLAVPVAIVSNVLLFYVLASVRTTPAAPRLEDEHTVPVAVAPVPIPEPAEPQPVRPEPDLIPIVSAATQEATVEETALSDITAMPAPRLLNNVTVTQTEWPGLPVLLPGRADLRSVPSPSVSVAELPHSLSTVDRPPRRIAGALPQVPRWARRSGLEGTVVLRFVVTAQGDVTNLNISRVEGDERFGPEAARKVATWRFEPAIKRGKAVPCWCFKKVHFKLDE